MYMLTRLFHYSIALGLSAIVLFSCKGKDGDPGPQGDAGTMGAAGAKGQPGSPASYWRKGGFVKGTITGLRADGLTPIEETFNYEYTDGFLDLDFDAVRETNRPGVYEFGVYRLDSASKGYFNLTFRAPLDVSADTVSLIRFQYNKEVSNSQLWSAYGSLRQYQGKPTVAQLSNLAYNRNTGMLTGNFTWTAGGASTSSYFNYSASGRPFTVTGSFSVLAPVVTSFRKGVRSN
jgi:hypothetical protein